MVHQGVAVTCHVSTLTNNPLYHKLQRRLLKAELQAEKKGAGIWIRPSLLERLQNKVLLPFSKMKGVLSAVQNRSVGSIFSRKSGKVDKWRTINYILWYHNLFECWAFKGTHCARAQWKILTLEIVNIKREYICKLFALRLYSFRNSKKTVQKFVFAITTRSQ